MMKHNKQQNRELASYKNKIMKNQRDIDEIHNEINHIFDNHLKGIVSPYTYNELGGIDILEPNIEITENNKALKIFAELPGLSPEDIDINVSTDGYLTITGEKHHETEDDDKGYYFSECSYGLIQRTIPLPSDVDTNKVSAEYKNGVLKIDILKQPTAQKKLKKIPVKAK